MGRKTTATTVSQGSAPLSPEEKRAIKQRVLTHKRPSQVRSIADAMVIKDEDLFFLCERDGQVPLRGRHGFGLYYRDCRYLNGYELRLNGRTPQALVATPRQGFLGRLQLVDSSSRAEQGQGVEQEDLGIGWERVVDGGGAVLHDRLTLENFSQQPVRLSVRLAFQAGFEDVFVVRGLLGENAGQLRPACWRDGVLCFFYEGGDGLYRSVQVHFSPPPQKTSDATAHFSCKAPPHGKKEFSIAIVLRESRDPNEAKAQQAKPHDVTRLKNSSRRAADDWLAGQTQFHSDSLFLKRTVDRSLRDLRVLRTNLDGKEFYAAGVPWFVTLFGRDSILAALQTLSFELSVAEQTLRLLAHYQGDEDNPWRDEQPGKILHELRRGELARMGEIPYTPYYGSIDAAPLFLILLARHARWCGSLDLFHELRGNVDRALDWIDQQGQQGGDGYLKYESASEHGLINQGWKDAGDSIVNADGSLARPPIALVEVQGYVYRAKRDLADLFERDGDAGRAEQLRREAEALRERFNRDFWLEDKQFFALALQDQGEPVAVIASNPGQALWTGIVDSDKAEKVARRLMAQDMFTGWGVRTLSCHELRYNPLGYHLGTVWPHDNSLIAAGLRRYGLDRAAQRIYTGVTRAASHLHAYRLPEVFAGFRREDFGVPVRYPVACHPQAWAAGTVPYLLETMLGLTPEGFERRLRIVRPWLPEVADFIELRQLQVGGGRVNLRFQRTAAGGAEVQVLQAESGVEVVVEPEQSPQADEPRAGGSPADQAATA